MRERYPQGTGFTLFLSVTSPKPLDHPFPIPRLWPLHNRPSAIEMFRQRPWHLVLVTSSRFRHLCHVLKLGYDSAPTHQPNISVVHDFLARHVYLRYAMVFFLIVS